MIPIIDQSRKLVVGKRLLNAGLRKSQVFVFIIFSVQSFEIQEPQVQILSHIRPLTPLALLLAAPSKWGSKGHTAVLPSLTWTISPAVS